MNSEEISYLGVEKAPNGLFRVAAHTKGGGVFYYAAVHDEDTAFATMHDLANEIGTVISDDGE